MALSTLPLSYCTNVHPGLTVDEILLGLEQYAAPIRRKLDFPLAAGLWLANPVIEELTANPARVVELKDKLRELELLCYTLNAFPFGNFHSERVKEQVYLPDWSDPARLQYTVHCAEVLAELLGDVTEGSISTVPLGFKQLDRPADFLERAMGQLLDLAGSLEDLFQKTGKRIRLAIEPEPLCLLETTPETLDFFDQLRSFAVERNQLELVNEYLGVCYDVCHQAVEFEEIAESIRALDQANIRINKMHITCAIDLPNPADNSAGRERLAKYVEPRYLHQTFARFGDGTIRTLTDLNADLCLDPPPHFRDAEAWRVHFHVPVNAENLGALGTTRNELIQAIETVASLQQTPHLEVETYTWSVMPGEEQPSLIEGFTAELKATDALLRQCR